jgi:aspartate/methionine/tyrosine aminotransferase
MFSEIAAHLDAEVNALYKTRNELRAQGNKITDLISGNINEAGIVYPQEPLEAVMLQALRESRVYRPDSFGQKPARAAIARYYETQGTLLDAGNILLTPGTSVAYWYCFKLLANEGDEILCPRPSYPLFDYIAALSGVKLMPYKLEEKNGWAIDLAFLEQNISNRTRAIVLISPHNPTGHVLSSAEMAGLCAIAARHNLPLIFDEVFNEFTLDGSLLPRPAEPAPLIFALNGFSKMFALPGMKLGWITLTGDPGRVKEAARALELISDTFLPVNEMVQAAVPGIFDQGERFLKNYALETRSRWQQTAQFLQPSDKISFIAPQGGFYVTLRLLAAAEDAAATTILKQALCLVHPGFFYDIEGNHLVMSFVQERATIRAALPKMLAVLDHLSPT